MQDKKEYIDLLGKAEYYCSRFEKCPDDIYKYLSKYTENNELINNVINELLANSYLDIDRYIKAYVNDKIRFERWGKFKIAYLLKQKKLPGKKVNEALAQIDEAEYGKMLKDLIKSKSSVIREPDLLKRKASLIRFL